MPGPNYGKLGKQTNDQLPVVPGAQVQPPAHTSEKGVPVGGDYGGASVAQNSGVNQLQVQPKVYDSTGDYGSGFVNLSHMLGLNRASGANSAADLAKRTHDAGQSAQSAIDKGYSDFKSAADAGGINTGSYASPNHDVATTQAGLDKANQGYKGPGSMADNSAYTALAKKVGSAEGMAKNSQTGWGMAAQVGKDTGLSPTQSAASSFYMGVNNPMVKSAGAAFTNLSKALSAANERSVNYADMSRNNYNQAQTSLASQLAADKDYQAGQAHEADMQKQISDAKTAADQADAARQAANPGKPTEGEGVDNGDAWGYKIGADGMPQGIKYTGETYDQWVAEGKPDFTTWQKKHPDAYIGK